MSAWSVHRPPRSLDQGELSAPGRPDLAPVAEATVPSWDDGTSVMTTAHDLEEPVGRVVHGQVAHFLDLQEGVLDRSPELTRAASSESVPVLPIEVVVTPLYSQRFVADRDGVLCELDTEPSELTG